MKYDNTLKCILLSAVIIYVLYHQSTTNFLIEGYETHTPVDSKKKYTCAGDPTSYTCAGENSGWPNCQGIPNTPAGFGITSDPCLTFPEGDVPDADSKDDKRTYGENAYFLNKGTKFTPPNDNLGNPVQNPTNWFTGRGLIQLTWSCNYMKIQRSIYFLRQGLNTKKSKLHHDWAQISHALNLSPGISADQVIEDIGDISVCRNPDSVCGNYTIQSGKPTINYSKNIVDQALPWLTCIIYWCEIINTKSSWAKNFDYLTALAGIGPSGGANSPKRVAFSVLYAYMMGLKDSDFKVQKGASKSVGISNICMAKTNSGGCAGGSSGGGGDHTCPGYQKEFDNKINCSQCGTKSCATVKDPTGVCSECWGVIRCTDSDGNPSTCGAGGGGGGGGGKALLPFSNSPIDILKFIMNMKTPIQTPSQCFKENDNYVNEYMTSDQKKFICADEDTNTLDNWESSQTQDKAPKNNLGNTNAMYFTYAVNCKMNQAGGDAGPLYDVGKPFSTEAQEQQINPMYTWEGLAFAAYLWNLGAPESPSLKGYGGFCASKDDVENKLTLAIFLGNAIVESANFMVCNESTVATGLSGTSSDTASTECNVYSQQSGFAGRYFNNCDDAEPCTYSCCKKGQTDCGGGGGGGGDGGGGQYPQCKATQDGISAGYTICSYRNKDLCNKSEPNGKHLCKWDGSAPHPPSPKSNKYSCNNKTCNVDPSGTYATLQDCQSNCKTPQPPPSPSGGGNCGSCSKGTCAGQGAWAGQCLNISKTQCDSYDSSQYQWCGGSSPAPPPKTSYNCVNNTCTPVDSGGTYTTLQDCQSKCASVKPDSTYGCIQGKCLKGKGSQTLSSCSAVCSSGTGGDVKPLPSNIVGFWRKSWKPSEQIPSGSNLIIDFEGYGTINCKGKQRPQWIPDGTLAFCNTGGGTAAIPKSVLDDLINGAAVGIKQSGYDGLSFDLESISGFSSTTTVDEIVKAFSDAFDACHQAGLIVLVTTSLDGFTGALVSSMPGADLTTQRQNLVTFLSGLANLLNIDIFSPQCYAADGITTKYAPNPFPPYNPPKYCDWQAKVIIPSITLNGVDDYNSTPSAASSYFPCHTPGYIAW